MFQIENIRWVAIAWCIMLEESRPRILDGRYKTLFESVNAAAFLTDIGGKIIEANQKSCWLFGYEVSKSRRGYF